MELSDLKKEVENIRAARRGQRGIRWPKQIREGVFQLKSQGHSVPALSKAINIPHQTLNSWVSRGQKRKFKPVHIKESFSCGLALRKSGGFEVTGLSFEQLKILLKEGLL